MSTGSGLFLFLDGGFAQSLDKSSLFLSLYYKDT